MLRRSLWSTLLALTVISIPPSSEGKTALSCTVSGKITNGFGRGVSVKLKPVEKDPLAYYDGYLGEVSDDGSFRFQDVAPGKYTVVAEGAEFMPSEYAAVAPGGRGIVIDLKAGEHRKRISITLAPKRIVCGKITDEKGQPLPKVEVYAFLHREHTDWLSFDASESMRTVSDANGGYSLPDLEPGEYFLQAGMSTWFSPFDKLTQAESENFTNAEPVEVGVAHGSQCDVNFLMRPRIGYMSRKVRGTIADDSALAGNDLVLSLLEVNRTGAINKWPFDVLNVGRTFEIQGPAPADYRLVVSKDRFPTMWSGPLPEFHELAAQQISISNKEDLNGITLRAEPMAKLSGRIKFDGVTPLAACPAQPKPRIGIQNDDNGHYYSVELRADGAFEIPDVSLGTYSVRVSPFLRGRTFIDSISLDGHSTDVRKIDLSSPGAHALEVVISGNTSKAAGHLAPDEPLERFEEPWIHPAASLSGRVDNQIAGKPLTVKLWAVRFNSDRSFEYSTKPNDDGTFSFENIDPGIYVLLTQGSGYALSEYGAAGPGLQGKAITLSPGRNLTGIALSASAQKPLLCGTVLDESGEPISNVAVSVWRKTRLGSFQISGGGVVIHDGHFQYNDLVPGTYLMWAEREEMGEPGRSPVRQVAYFSSSPNLDGAQQIEIGSDWDFECKHDIQFRHAETFHIKGAVPKNLIHQAGEVFDASVSETNAAGAERWSAVQSRLQPGDPFTFSEVHPGSYVLRLEGPYKPISGPASFSGPCRPPAPHLVSSQSVSVKDQDVNDLVIDLDSQVSVTGRILYDSVPTESNGLRVNLPRSVNLYRENLFCPVGAELSSEGEFTLNHLEAGEYRVGLYLTGPLYIKSILLNGNPLDGKSIILSRGMPAKLAITVAGDGGEVEAEVAHSMPLPESYRNDEPCLSPKMQGGFAAFLIPDHIPDDGSGVLNGRMTNEGFIQFTGVPPGLYHAVAAENASLLVGEQFTWQDPKYLQAISALGSPVRVDAGKTLRVKLTAATSHLQDASASFNHPIVTYEHCNGSCSE